MLKALRILFAALLFAGVLVGCGPDHDKSLDHVDPESLKAMEHPPPGVPGAPSKGKAPVAPPVVSPGQ